jgi:hypothetical protein
MLNFKLKYVLFTVLGCSTFVLRVRIPWTEIKNNMST